MREEFTTANMARLFEWHWDLQRRPYRVAWTEGIARLIQRTDCDATYLAVKWGVGVDIVLIWLQMGRASVSGDVRTVYELDAELSSASSFGMTYDWAIHDARCPCDVTGIQVSADAGIYAI